jgi:hypothetical protein
MIDIVNMTLQQDLHLPRCRISVQVSLQNSQEAFEQEQNPSDLKFICKVFGRQDLTSVLG